MLNRLHKDKMSKRKRGEKKGGGGGGVMKEGGGGGGVKCEREGLSIKQI